MSNSAGFRIKKENLAVDFEKETMVPICLLYIYIYIWKLLLLSHLIVDSSCKLSESDMGDKEKRVCQI